ncbi:MAG TPA: efflux RND transporter periplasmic adaptor subunit [Candidatus Limnocylindrales bacterium]|nr:efflux RND transporter periplasmic adaptor subunit [Candidatus Limnocylindrales bacterium]
MEPKYYLVLKRQRLKIARIRKILITGFLIFFGFLGFLIYLMNSYSQAQSSVNMGSLTSVQVQPVKVVELVQEIGTDIEVQPSWQVHVTTPIPGARIAALYVDLGDYVEEGQVLLELDPALLMLELKQAEDEVKSAKARLEEIQKTQATRHEERVAAVHRAEDEVKSAKARLEEIQKTQATRHEERVAAVHRAEGEVESAKARLEEIKKIQEARHGELVAAFQQAEEVLRSIRTREISKSSEPAPAEFNNRRLLEDFVRAKNTLTHESVINRSMVTSAEATYKLALEAAIKARNAMANEKVLNRSEQAVAELAYTQALENLVKAQNQLKNEEATLQSELAAAEANYTTAFARRTQIQYNLTHTTVKAPVSGIVIEQNIHPGEVMTPYEGSSRNLLTLGVVDPAVVIAGIGSESNPSVYTGQPARIVVEDPAEAVLEGTVIKIEQNPSKPELKVYVKISNPNLALKPGVFAHARFQNKRLAPVIPKTALIHPADPCMVLVVDPDFIVRKRLIEVGLSMDGLIEVVRGIQEGEQVITSGQQFIKEGDKIKIATDTFVALNRS